MPIKSNRYSRKSKTLLRQRHHITNGKEDDFNVRNLTSLMETMTQTTTMLTLFLGSIAAISLVVGGIGIMNIMMVSVTERTREIGIRKALGATFQNIMMQFLIESVVIGVIGGLLGVACGVGIALAIAESGLFETVITQRQSSFPLASPSHRPLLRHLPSPESSLASTDRALRL